MEIHRHFYPLICARTLLTTLLRLYHLISMTLASRYGYYHLLSADGEAGVRAILLVKQRTFSHTLSYPSTFPPGKQRQEENS